MERWTLPEGWEYKSFAEICRINPKRPRLERGDEVPTSFLPMQAVDEQVGVIVDMQIRPYGEVKRGYTYFEENDVLMAKITPSMENGKAAIARNLIDGIGFGTTEFHVFHPNSYVLPEWIFYFVRRKTFREKAKMNFRGAVGQQRVPEDFLVNQEIPIPYPYDPARSLAEQRRIVARLEALLGEVRAMRALIRAMRQQWDELMQSALGEVFEQNSGILSNQQLEKVAEIHDSGRLPVKQSERKAGAIPYCGANGIIDYVDGFTHDGEFVLLAEDGGNFKSFEQSAYIMTGKFWANNHVHILRGIPGLLNSKYLFYVLYYADLTPYLTGATRPKLTQSAMRKVLIPVPYWDNPSCSIAEQQRIVAHLEAVQAEVSAARQALEADERRVAELEQSILAAAFRGEM